MRTLVTLAVFALLGAGSGCATGAAGSAPTADADGWPTAVVAATGARVGPSGTGCSIPVSLDIPDGWIARKVAGGGYSALARIGVYPVCEIRREDGSPGVMRVWVGRVKLNAERILGVYTEDSKYIMKRRDARKVTVAGEPAWELWRETVAGDDKLHQYRAFAVVHNGVGALVEWGGTEMEPHRAGLPGYFLARKTFTFGGGATL
jgi:hypothetical protein